MPSMRTTQLFELQKRQGAQFTDKHAWDMLDSFGDPVAEYRAVRTAVGVTEPPFLTFTRIEGKGATPFIHAQLDGMPELSEGGLADGEGIQTYLTNGLGGILAVTGTFRTGDEYLVASRFDKNQTLPTLLQDRALGTQVTVTDMAAISEVFSVDGPRALELVTALAPKGDREQIAGMQYLENLNTSLAGVEVRLVRHSGTGEDGFFVATRREDSPEVWQVLVEAASSLGGLPYGWDAATSLRVEDGLPLYGQEFTSNTVLGEVVPLRGNTPSRQLLGLRAKQPGLLTEFTGLVIRGGSILGEATSLVHSPAFDRMIALMVLDRGMVKPGELVQVRLSGQLHDFEVLELPMA